MEIELKGLSFSFPGSAVSLFSSIDLTFERSGVNAVIGPNGSGKSTLLRIAAGILKGYGGVVEVNGRDIRRLSPHERARFVSYVPQETSIPFDFSVFDVVMMGRSLYTGRFGFESREDRRMVMESLSLFGIEGLHMRGINEISGGERQMVLIARAIAQGARSLLLDEPAAFLDIRHRLMLFEVLHELGRERSVLSILTTHDLTNIPPDLHSVTLLPGDGGALSGPTVEVMRREVLEGVFGVGIDVVPLGGRDLLVPSRVKDD